MGTLHGAGRAQIQYSSTHRRLYAENFQVLSLGHHFNLPPGPASVSREGRELPVFGGALPCSPHHPTTGTQGKAAGVYLGFERAKLGSAGGFPLRKRIHKYNTNLGMKTNIYLEGERKSPQSPGALGVQVPFFRHLFRQVTRHSWLFSPPRTLCDPQDPPPLTGAQAKRRS